MSQYLTDEEISDYGPSFVDVMRRVAAETAAHIPAPLNEEISRLRQAVGFVQQETGNVFLERMSRVGFIAALAHGLIAGGPYRDVFGGPDYAAEIVKLAGLP